jgi:hypothetical protein
VLDNQSSEDINVPLEKDEEKMILSNNAPNNEDEDESQQKQQMECDDNQNNVNNRMILLQNFNIGAASERILVNLKQLLALYAKLKRQLMEFAETKANEQSSYKAKCDEISSEVIN